MQISKALQAKSGKWMIALIIAISISFVLIPIVEARTPPNVKAFPTIKKLPELPSGSEATAIAILLNYHGVQITKEEVGQMLPREPLPIVVGERMIGGDPTRAYIGDPFTAEGLGAYHQPMVRVLGEFLPGRVIDRTRQPFSQILGDVSQGSPFIVWVTEGLKPAHITHFWWTVDEHLIQWHGNQNTVVLFDFDESHVYVSDPHTGQIEAYERKNFERVWRDLGSRAIGIDANRNGTMPNTPSTPVNQPGNNRPSIDYEEERRKLIAEIQRQRDPKSADKEPSENEEKKTKVGIELWIVIIATFIFLASFITLLIITLKGSKDDTNEQPQQKDEAEEEDIPRNKGRR